MSDPNDELQVEIKGLMLDPASNVPIVILRDTREPVVPADLDRRLRSQRHRPADRGGGAATPDDPRPPAPVVEQLGATVEKIVISDLRESTFFALHPCPTPGATRSTVDARPSDAIALALRTDAPIFVLRAVLDKAQAADLATQVSDEEKLKKLARRDQPGRAGQVHDVSCGSAL